MEIAHIVPISNMYFMEKQPINMLLTHLALSNQVYATYAKYLSTISYTILDNSLIENNREAMSFSDVIRIAEKINAHEVVLTDVYQDKSATKEAILTDIKMLHDKYGSHIPFRLMAVAQGKTYKQIRDIISFYEDIPEITTIGIPKYLAKMHPQGRPAFERAWKNSTKEIHLLGLQYSFEELSRYKFPDKIRSVDTCLAAYFVLHNMPLTSVRPDGYTINLETTVIPLKSWENANSKENRRCLLNW